MELNLEAVSKAVSAAANLVQEQMGACQVLPRQGAILRHLLGAHHALRAAEHLVGAAQHVESELKMIAAREKLGQVRDGVRR